MEMTKVNLIPQAGERALIVGQTGSGKTAFACWLMLRIPETPIIIYDTKIEPKFRALPNSTVVHNIMAAKTVMEESLEFDYIIVEPDDELLDKPEELDAMLMFHYRHMHNTVAYIDEAATFHRNGRAFAGILALMSRGRSKGITTICSTQRPRGISRSLITEAQKIYVMYLADLDDKKRLNDVIPNYAKLPNPVKHGFYYFESAWESPILFRPVTLDKALDTGYTDKTQSNIIEPAYNTGDKHLWV